MNTEKKLLENENEPSCLVAVRRSSRPKITDRNPDETGIYINDNSVEVNVWVNYTGRCHGSDDYFEVFIQTTDGKYVTRFTEIYSQIPSFVVNGKGYYKGK
jgi:hypothetical protein